MILLEREVRRGLTSALVAAQARVALAPVSPFTTADAPVTQSVTWPPVVGADGVEVVSGSLTVGADPQAQRTLSSLSPTKSDGHTVINLGATVKLTALTLDGLTYRPQGGSDDLPFSPTTATRLVIAIPNDQTGWLPLYAIPPVQRDSTPQLYAGATLSGKTVRFPVAMPTTNRLRISVIENFGGAEERVLTSTLSSASAQVKQLPENLTVTTVADDGGADDGELFRQAGLYLDNAPDLTLDLVSHAQGRFDEQLRAGAALTFGWRVATKAGSAFHYAAQPVQGALIRTFPGVTAIELKGVSRPLPLDLAAGPLAMESPVTVTADLTLTYGGLRVLTKPHGTLPPGAGNVQGRIVGAVPVGCPLLNPEVATYGVAQIGLIGRAPEACELSVWLAPQLADGRAGAALTPPGVVQLAASGVIGLHWVELPQPVTDSGPLVVQVRANRGRFFWVADPAPAIKVAVLDPEPNQRLIWLQDRSLVAMQAARLHLPRVNLAADLFVNQPPALASDLFVTIEVGDLTLRYER